MGGFDANRRTGSRTGAQSGDSLTKR